MRNLAVLFIHLLATLACLLGPGGVGSLVAESLLLKHQLLILPGNDSPIYPRGDHVSTAKTSYSSSDALFQPVFVM
jgi:hypothetical protein